MLSGHSFYTAVTKGHNVNATISLGIDLHLTASSQELKWGFLTETTRTQTERMLTSMQLSRLPGRKIPQQTTKSQP